MTPPGTRFRLLALVAIFALIAVACSSAEGADRGVVSLEDAEPAGTLAVGDDAVADQTEEEALLAFTACLRDQGLDVADPTVDADGNLQLTRPTGGQGTANFDRQAFRDAREACEGLLDGVTLGFGGDLDLTEFQDSLLEFAQCVRDNGYDMADPDFTNFGEPGQGGPGGGPFGEIDFDDPAFEAAQEACGDILGDNARFGAGRRGGGGGNG